LENPAKRVRLRTTDGREITITDARISGDTVFGTLARSGKPFRAEITNIQSISTRRPDPLRTGYLIVGTGVFAVTVGVMVIALPPHEPKYVVDPCSDCI